MISRVQKSQRSEGTYIFIASSILAELTKPVGSILDIAARRADEGFSVALARLARRGVKARKLASSADELTVVNSDAEESFEQIMEGGKPVHPRLPKVRQRCVWHHHTAERDHE